MAHRRATTAALLFTFGCIALCWLYGAYNIISDTDSRSLQSSKNQFARTKSFSLPSVCSNLVCKADYLNQFSRAGSQNHPIPAIRHLIWRNESVSEYFADQLRSWQRIHPDWTVVLWRDQDLVPFVKRNFPGALGRFEELEPHRIMQVDMIRYMLLYKFGGVYADLDYTLSANLDEYRRFHALLTREPEAHSLQYFGFQWPPRLLANPAFMASAPMHPFFRHCIERLQTIPFTKGHPLSFAGPFGLTQLLEDYSVKFPLANFHMETVYIPPSYSFYPYEKNRLSTSKSAYLSARINRLKDSCKSYSGSSNELLLYCRDINNMDPITDSSQPIVAVHDMQKTGAIYDNVGTKFFTMNLTSVRSVYKYLQIGPDWI